MGKGERTRVLRLANKKKALTEEEALAETLRVAHQRQELKMGPVLRSRVYASDGCPKCGTPADLLKYKWDPGYDGDLKAPCMVENEHLHGFCPACDHEWREQVRDCEDEKRRAPCAQLGDTGYVEEPTTEDA